MITTFDEAVSLILTWFGSALGFLAFCIFIRAVLGYYIAAAEETKLRKYRKMIYYTGLVFIISIGLVYMGWILKG
ncbi:MAG: hypothetical protein GF335_00955 [Candidatus Moranbacteria bacterium]|nr:hypothetical protein [Candidatus Moranbacteria bacterium]